MSSPPTTPSRGPAPWRFARLPCRRAARCPRTRSTSRSTFPFPSPAPAPLTPQGQGQAGGPSKPLAIDVFIVPDGARSWIGVGGDAALVSAKLAGGDRRLGATPWARSRSSPSLKDAIVGAGGFFTARRLPEIGAQFGVARRRAGRPRHGADLFEGSAQLPHQGATPIPFTLTAPPRTPGTVVATLQVPRGTIDDVVVTIVKHGF